MSYTASLGPQTISIANQGNQTVITLSSQAAGQQQSQSSRFTTGEWRTPPALFRTPTGAIAKIQADAVHFIQLQAGGMQILSQPPSLSAAEPISMQHRESSSLSDQQPMQPMKPMQPMQPMKPMQMGDMELRMNPMEMRMGDMELRMGKPSSSSPSATHQFCTQCGQAVAPTDKFCAHCGQALRQ
jgi:NADH pyrophosphatase NudC (nudix superfamily)